MANLEYYASEPPRLCTTWDVLEAAKDTGDEMVIAACRRIIVAHRLLSEHLSVAPRDDFAYAWPAPPASERPGSPCSPRSSAAGSRSVPISWSRKKVA
jgi:hypothetical protein